SGTVHAFEIDPRPIRCLRKTIARHRLPNLFLHELAVGHRNGAVGLVLEEDSGNSGVASEGSGHQVQMITLDSWWKQRSPEQIQAIKLDIEGAELLALQGGTEMLLTMRPV